MFGIKKKNTGKALNIFIIGCGDIGLALIGTLVKENHNITLIDEDDEKVQITASQYDIMAYTGNGASYRMLVDSGIQEADILVAVTESDEVNLLCCSVASQVSSCSTIARVRTPEYSEEVWYLRDKLGLTMVINPELEAAVEMARIINVPDALEVSSFARGEGELVTFKVKEGSKLDGHKLSEFMPRLTNRLTFAAVKRGDQTFIPKGSYVFKAGDIVSYAGARRHSLSCRRDLGLPTNQLKSCFIIGGGSMAYYLSNTLLKAGYDVKIVERDFERCEKLSEMLPQAMIINADGSDTAALAEEGMMQTEAIVSLTDIDEVNIMLSLFASNSTEAKIVTRINRFELEDVASSLEIGSIVNPRYVAMDMILGYARAKSVSKEANIETLYHLFDDEVEAIEFAIGEGSPLTGIPLSELRLKDNIMIAFIYRNGRLFFPGGNDTIEPGDSVMIVTTDLGYRDVLDILE